MNIEFASTLTGARPCGFTEGLTGQGDAVCWQVLEDPSAPGGKVIGEVDQAAGLIARARDAENYYVVRANALEANVRLYKVVGGVRRQIAGRNVEVTSGVWHSCRSRPWAMGSR